MSELEKIEWCGLCWSVAGTFFSCMSPFLHKAHLLVSGRLTPQEMAFCPLSYFCLLEHICASHLPRTKILWLGHSLVRHKIFLAGTARSKESPKGAEPAHLHVPEQRKSGWKSKGLIYFLFHFVWLKQSGVRVSNILRKALEYK